MDDRQEAYREAEAAKAARQRERMRTELLPALAAAGVDAVEVEYLGDADPDIDTDPDVTVGAVRPAGVFLPPPLRAAVEAAVVDLLDARDDGWGFDQSTGVATLDVVARAVRFEHRVLVYVDAPFAVALGG